MAYGLAWLWNLDQHDEEKAKVHTMTIGAARPSDLDQLAVAAYLQGKGLMLDKVTKVSERLRQAAVAALGQDWLDSCYDGVVKSTHSKHLLEHNQMVWMYNCIKAWGMLGFCQDRFRTFINNHDKLDVSLATDDEKIDKIGRGGWGYTPGLVPEADWDYFADDLAGVPEKNRARIKEAYNFVIRYCSPKIEKKDEKAGEGKGGDEKKEECQDLEIPSEYLTSFEMKPWKDYPDRTYPY